MGKPKVKTKITEVMEDGQAMLRVQTQYHPELPIKWKGLKGRWEPATKTWLIPAHYLSQVHGVIASILQEPAKPVAVETSQNPNAYQMAKSSAIAFGKWYRQLTEEQKQEILGIFVDTCEGEDNEAA